ncbi:MAG: VacJ family lipoprotein [Desulfobulbaceae bacterium]|jgi:phospholipid-binding lipoprotein MlaA|nr:VacJ family lipoprotein [Desulfobulbaceae bacterium]
MRLPAFLLLCLLASPAVVWGVDVDVDSLKDSFHDNYGGVVIPNDRFGSSGKSTVPDLLDDEDFDDGADAPRAEVADPLEGWNRLMFRLNDKLYVWALRPTADFYAEILPGDIRGCIDNFFTNLGAPVRLLNSFLQGRFKDAGTELSRFAINSTIGVAGLADVAAADFGISRRRADFGQTLGRYGLGNGFFICWPILGPSTLRETVGTVVDSLVNPTTYIEKSASETITVNAVQIVNKLSVSPDIYTELKKNSLDPYVAMRQGYVDYRRALIQGGKQNAEKKTP